MRVQAEAGVAEAAEEHVEQVGAVHVIVRRTEMSLRPLAERCPVEAVAIVPGPIVPSLRKNRHTCQCVPEAERSQYPRCIGTELNASSNLSERLRLLEQKRLDAALPQRQGERDAADPAACDQDFESTLGHDFLLRDFRRKVEQRRAMGEGKPITFRRART